MKYLSKLFFSWGVPIIIGFFAWGLFGNSLINSEFFSENLLVAFIITSIVAYFLGLAFRVFVIKTKVDCPKCHSSLMCPKCNTQVFEVDGE